MKKLLLLISALCVASNPVVLLTEQYSIKSKYDLKKYLTNPHLETIAWDEDDYIDGTIPSDKKLIKILEELNPKLDGSGIVISEKTINSAVVTGDGKIYLGRVRIDFKIANKIDLKNIIKDEFYLGLVNTNGKDHPNSDDLIKVLQDLFPRLNSEKIKIDIISDSQAKITGDEDTYLGNVDVTFFSNKSVDLKDVIIDSDLGLIKTNGFENITEDILKNVLKEKYPNLKLNSIDIEIVSNKEAIISSNDSAVYTGDDISINFTIDKSMSFDLVLVDTYLGTINISQELQEKDIAIALKANNQNPKLNINWIEIEIVSDSQAIISSKDQTIYTGNPITVKYRVNRTRDLKDIIQNPDLGIIKVAPNQELPTKEDIISHLKDYSLDFSKLNIDIKSDSLAIISSNDSNVYVGKVDLTFRLDRSVDLKSVLHRTNLKTIFVNPGKLPSFPQLKAAIKAENPDINTAYINIVEGSITKQSAIVTGNQVNYQGKVEVNFEIDDSTLSIPFSYREYADYQPFSPDTEYYGKEAILLANWKEYAQDWDDFTTKLPQLKFDDDSEVSIVVNTYTNNNQIRKGKDLTLAVKDITTDQNKKFFEITFDYNGGLFGAVLHLKMHVSIWRDERNIYLKSYWKMDSSKCTRNRTYTVDLKDFTFSK